MEIAAYSTRASAGNIAVSQPAKKPGLETAKKAAVNKVESQLVNTEDI
jgi:hypothetical protein